MENKRLNIVRALTLGGGLVVALLISGCRAGDPRPRQSSGAASGASGMGATDLPTPETTPGRPQAAPGIDSNVMTVSHAKERDYPPRWTAPVDAEPPEPDGVLPLPEAIAYGLRHNPRLAQVQAQVEASRQGVKIAFAPFLPGINFNSVFAAYNLPILPGGAFVAASINRGTFAYSLAEFNVQYTLIDFGRRTGRYQQAKGQAQIEGLVFDRARQTVAFDVATSYFSLLQAKAQVRVLEEAARRAGEFNRDANARREGGTIYRESVLRSDVDVSRAEEELVAGRQGVLDADALLNQALGRACATPIEAIDVRRRPDFCDTREACLQHAADLRPEIATAREETAVAVSGVRIARGAALPKVYVNASLIQADLEGVIDRLVEGIGINIDQTVFAGGARIAAIRQARAQVRAAAAGLRVILDNVSAEVNLAYNGIDTDRQRIRLSASAAKQARENLRVVVVRFNNGDAIPTEVIDAQTALTSAEVRYYNAAYGYLADLAKLSYAQGADLAPLVDAVMADPARDEERINLPGSEPGDAPTRILTPPPGVLLPGRPDLDLPRALPDRPV